MKKKILSLLVLLVAAVTGAWAQETVTWTWDDLKTIKVADGQTYDEFSMGNNGWTRKSITLKGITLCCYYVGTKEYNHVYGYTGSLAQYYQWNNGSKFYMVCSDYFDDDGKKSGNFTFSCEDEYVITKMKMVCPNCTTYVAIPDGVCEVEGSTDFGGGGCTITWTGAKQEILFDCNVDVSSIEFTIEPDAPATDYKFNVAKCEHGTGKVSFTVQDKDDAEKITENAKGANEGDKVTVTIAPDEGWVVDPSKVSAKAATNWEAAGARRMAPEENLSLDMLGDIELTFVGTDTETGVATFTFTMPASSVLVTPAFLKLSTLYFDPADRTNLMEVKVDGIVRNVEDSKTVKIEKVEGVIEGTEITLTANTGYKFRKVEVKKKGAELPKYVDVVTICEKNGDNNYLISSFFDGTNANITTITKEEAIALAEYLGGGDIRVAYEEYAFSSYRYVRTTNAEGKTSGVLLSSTNALTVPLYYVPAGN